MSWIGIVLIWYDIFFPFKRKIEIKLCKNCEYHKYTGENSISDLEKSYNYMCSYPDLPKERAINPVTGKETIIIKGTFGEGEELPFCSVINYNGQCKYFVDRNETSSLIEELCKNE